MNSAGSIPNIIHQIWYQGENQLPLQYQQWRQTVIDHNPDFQHQLWSEAEIIHLLEAHYPHYLALYLQLPHMHLKIDMIKPLILHHVGGIYIDMDCIAFNSFHKLQHSLSEYHHEIFCVNPAVIMQRMFCLPGASDYAFLNNNFIASRPGHPFLLDIVNAGIRYFQKLPPRYKGEKYIRRVILESFGPRQLTHCYHQYCQRYQDINIINSGTFEFSEFEKKVGQFYGIPGIHDSKTISHCISHSYEVTWMPSHLQKRFKLGYKLLPQILEYHYAPKNHWEKVKGLPWIIIKKVMQHIKWNRNLIGEPFCKTPQANQIDRQYHVYAKQRQYHNEIQH